MIAADQRYEALLVYSVVESCSGQTPENSTPDLQRALADRAVVIEIDNLAREMRFARDYHARIERSLAAPGPADQRTDIEDLLAKKSELTNEIAAAETKIGAIRAAHPALADALQAYYRVRNVSWARRGVEDAERQLETTSRAARLARDQMIRADTDLAEAVAAKKRKRDEYIDCCREVGRDPTPEPPPSANQ